MLDFLTAIFAISNGEDEASALALRFRRKETHHFSERPCSLMLPEAIIRLFGQFRLT